MERITANQKMVITLLLGVLIGLMVSLVSIKQKQPCTPVGGGCYRLERVDNPQERKQGLSGRTAVGGDEGMLFVFNNPGSQCMWMKDMNFPLDMIWLDGRGRVVDVEKNVSPETYPDSFCGDNDSRYVIELSAGEIAESGLQVGDFVVVN